MSKEDFSKHLEKNQEVGSVIYSSGSIVHISGLPSLKLEEEVVTESGERGMVYNMKEDKVEALMFGAGKIETGDKVARAGKSFCISVSDNVLGRIVNPLCIPVDGDGPIGGEKKEIFIKREAPGITKRVVVDRPLETGVTMVDFLVPIGYGQREMVVGDAKTGKTTFLLQTIANQVKKGVICVYVGIGKESSSLKSVEEYLKEAGVFDKVVMMITPSNQPPTLHYIAPLAGMSVAEYFRDMGKDVLIVFDDLSIHAKAYREISLLLRNPPGREAYPGDVFHLHAALIERAGNIKINEKDTASITALPVAETLENDISGFIQTNLLSMTDGHIFFDINEFRKGKFPSINPFLSVSRVGNQTKGDLDKSLVGKIRNYFMEYRKIVSVAQFGAELSEEKQQLLDFGRKMEVLFTQGTRTLLPRPIQLVLFGLLFSGFWREISAEGMGREVIKVVKILKEEIFYQELERRVVEANDMDQLKEFCEEIIPKIEKLV